MRNVLANRDYLRCHAIDADCRTRCVVARTEEVLRICNKYGITWNDYRLLCRFEAAKLRSDTSDFSATVRQTIADQLKAYGGRYLSVARHDYPMLREHANSALKRRQEQADAWIVANILKAAEGRKDLLLRAAAQLDAEGRR